METTALPSESLSDKDYRLILETFPGCFLILGTDFTIVAASDLYLRATKRTREELVGLSMFAAFPDNPDDKEATGVKNLRASLENALKARGADTMAVQKYDIARPASEGGGFEERYWSPVNYAVVRTDGEVACLIHRVEDVTEFIRLKNQDSKYSALTEDLKIRSQQMEAEVYQRAQEIQNANKQLQAANKALEDANLKIKESERLKGEFFANVSHELRTPLTLILAPLESLLSKEAKGLEDNQRDMLQTVYNNAIRLLQMVSGLLDFAKLEAGGKIVVKDDPTDAVALTRSLLLDFEPLAKRKEIALNFEANEPQIAIQLDRYLYERIIFNLVSNALKFTPNGGKISVAVALQGKVLSVAVADTGIGISAQDQGHLFQKFRQLEGASTRRFEGTGLGLALAKEFASLLGGDLSVKSELGFGAEFTFKCTVVKTSFAIDETPRSPATVSNLFLPLQKNFVTKGETKAEKLDRKKVLIAEDNRELAEYIASQLDNFCQTRITHDGEEARLQAHTWEPDLVLSDVMMPKCDGIELCKALKGAAETAHIPVVLLTALTHRDAMLRGWEAGANEYLFKPFHPQELTTRVKTMLALVEDQHVLEAQLSRWRELEDFVYFASHDLKEPLRNVTTFSQLLQKKYAGKFDVDGAHFLSFVLNGAQKMQRLIDDLISYAVVDKEDTTSQICDCDAALTSALTKLNSVIAETGARITRGPLPSIRGSERQITSVFLNLLGNALKFRTPGASPTIEIRAQRTEGEWLVSVRDNGIGFEKKYSSFVFLIFKRLHAAEAYPGTGMGLAICKRVVERHRGKIWAEAEPNRGSQFFFTLPAVEAAESLARKPSPPLSV